jgi:hypothetical protein
MKCTPNCFSPVSKNITNLLEMVKMQMFLSRQRLRIAQEA